MLVMCSLTTSFMIHVYVVFDRFSLRRKRLNDVHKRHTYKKKRGGCGSMQFVDRIGYFKETY